MTLVFDARNELVLLEPRRLFKVVRVWVRVRGVRVRVKG
jgi:hypothetical protein